MLRNCLKKGFRPAAVLVVAVLMCSLGGCSDSESGWLEGRAFTMNGRLHPACGEEVEAVAKHLMWADEIPRWEKTYGEAPDEDFFWKRDETVGTRDGYLTLAEELLEIARKKVEEGLL